MSLKCGLIKLKLDRRSSKFQACPSAAAYLASAVNSHRRDCRPVAAYLFTKWVFFCLAFLQPEIVQACAYWQTFPSHILSFCGALWHAGPGGEAFKSGGEKIKSLMKLKIIFQPFFHLQVSYVTQLTAWSAGPEAGAAVSGLAQKASKLQLGKVHRLSYCGQWSCC